MELTEDQIIAVLDLIEMKIIWNQFARVDTDRKYELSECVNKLKEIVKELGY